MIMKTAELTGDALDWAVVNCIVDVSWKDNEAFIEGHLSRGSPSRDWDEGGKLIERWGITIIIDHKCGLPVLALTKCGGVGEGPTHLVAAMRSIIDAKEGPFVEVPEKFTGE